MAESVRSSATLNPAQAKKCEEIVKKTKKTKSEQIALKNRAAAQLMKLIRQRKNNDQVKVKEQNWENIFDLY